MAQLDNVRVLSPLAEEAETPQLHISPVVLYSADLHSGPQTCAVSFWLIHCCDLMNISALITLHATEAGEAQWY